MLPVVAPEAFQAACDMAFAGAEERADETEKDRVPVLAEAVQLVHWVECESIGTSAPFFLSNSPVVFFSDTPESATHQTQRQTPTSRNPAPSFRDCVFGQLDGAKLRSLSRRTPVDWYQHP